MYIMQCLIQTSSVSVFLPCMNINEMVILLATFAMFVTFDALVISA